MKILNETDDGRHKFQCRIRRWVERNFRRPFTGSSESGQGILEYILVLVIILVVILGLVYQFNRKFRLYAEQFFDGYIACLLESGELPGVGGSSCEEEMKTIADMQAKGLLKFPEGAGGGGGDGKNAADQKAPEDAARDRAPARTETVGGGGRTTNWGNFGRNSGSGNSTPVGRTDAAKKDSETVGYSALAANSGRFGNYSNPTQRVNTTYVNGDGVADDDPKKGKPPVAKTDKKSEDARALKPRRAIEDTRRRSVASIDVNEGEFSFGAMIRWLIIAALILAIIIFFGGQLLQIMRSREKGGAE